MPKALSLSFTVVPSVAFLADLWVLLAWDHKLPPPAPAQRLSRRCCAVMRPTLARSAAPPDRQDAGLGGLSVRPRV